MSIAQALTPTPSATDPVPFGLLATGGRLDLRLHGRHWLFGGNTGGGKSVALYTVFRGVADRPDVQLVLIDTKRVGLAPMAPRAAIVAVTQQQAAAALRRVGEGMDARHAAMVTAGVDLHTPTVADPFVIVIIDELQDLVSAGLDPAGRKLDDECSARLGHVLAQGRAAGVAVIVATQHPSHDLIPTHLRARLPHKVAFATERVEGSTAILGDAGRDTAKAHELRQDRPGLCWVTVEESRIPRLARGYHVPIDRARAVAHETAHLRRGLTLGLGVDAEADPIGLVPAALPPEAGRVKAAAKQAGGQP